MTAAPPPVVIVLPRGLGDTTSVQSIITNAANANGVPPSIALAVAQHESGLNPSAQNSGSSAAGLFQLTNATQQTMGVTNPYDPTQNANAATQLLAQYYAKYGNWNDALQAFSDGPGTVGVSPPSSQTLDLVSKVQQWSGVNFSPDYSSGSIFDFSSLGLELPSFSFPDLSQDSLISGVPDWVTWGGIGLLGAAAVLAVARG